MSSLFCWQAACTIYYYKFDSKFHQFQTLQNTYNASEVESNQTARHEKGTTYLVSKCAEKMAKPETDNLGTELRQITKTDKIMLEMTYLYKCAGSQANMS